MNINKEEAEANASVFMHERKVYLGYSLSQILLGGKPMDIQLAYQYVSFQCL